jgi:adenosylcobinamide kinase/adenosylcobinamide-phosphate guanylyltransferase
VLGGARSGKSAHAESLLAYEQQVTYVATAATDPADTEFADRIARHRARRPQSWTTAETADLVEVFGDDGPPALVDSVTAWLARVMDDAGIWTADGSDAADERLAAELEGLVGAWAATSRRVVAVSDEVGGGIVPDNAAARRFRDELGLLNQRLAAGADEVWLVTAGIPLQLR